MAAVCGSAGSSPFSRTVQIATLEEAEQDALILREVSWLAPGSLTTGTFARMAVTNVPVRAESDHNGGAQRMMFGFPGLKFQRKTILVVGDTGSGKTT